MGLGLPCVQFESAESRVGSLLCKTVFANTREGVGLGLPVQCGSSPCAGSGLPCLGLDVGLGRPVQD